MMRSGSRMRRCLTTASALFAMAVCALALAAGDARPAGSDQVTITMLVNQPPQAGYQLLIPNFERVYPNIKVEPTYVSSDAVRNQLTATELAAGNAPDLLTLNLGCGNTISVCPLAKAGYVAPLVREPELDGLWLSLKFWCRSLPVAP